MRGSLDDGGFSIWYLRGDQLAGTLSVGRSEDLQAARAWVAADSLPASDAQLADLDTDLDSL